MIYAKIRSKEEQKRLDNALRTAKTKDWYLRLQIIALSAQEYNVKKLSEMFNLCHATIRNYIHSYNQGGLSELAPATRPGRPPKIAHWSREQWDEVLVRTPNQYEKLNTDSRQWTLEYLRLYLREYHGIDVSIASICNSLRKTGSRTGRSRLRAPSSSV